MRILAGKLKHSRILSPKGCRTRPTLAKVRQSVFDTVQSTIRGAHFLDLFSGSGAMGLEALSRGAVSVTFVENDAAAARCIRHNLQMLGLRGQVMQWDVYKAVKRLKQTFHLIYADPPYDLDICPLLQQLPPLLREGGVIFFEQSSRRRLDGADELPGRKKRIGDTILYLFSPFPAPGACVEGC